MQEIDIKEILEKFKNNQCSEEENSLLVSWYLNWNKDSSPKISEQELLEIESEMQIHLVLKKPSLKLYWMRIASVAAALLVFIGVGFYALKKPIEKRLSVVVNKQDVLPGGNKAILILGDGKIINLEQQNTGFLAKEGQVVIKKNRSGQIVYDLSGQLNNANTEITYNTIQTPRAGTYQITLPDGTKVWLNSASKIKFPSSFAKNERKVELIGEAYFEVAENPSKPFRVVSAQQVIEVLGTHFDVNTYDDEPVKLTTLLKGSVKVSSGSTSRIIKPGEQSQIKSTGFIDVAEVDTAPITAWKDGMFSFKKADLKTVMRQISRWYDVDVEYGNKIPAISFTGKIYRNVTLQEALKSIGYLDVKYILNKRLVSFDTDQH